MTRTRQLLTFLFLFFCATNLFSQNFFQKTYNLDFKDEGRGLEVMPNGDIVTAGATGDAGAEKVWVQRLNSQGEVLWSKTFEETDNVIARDVQRMTDGNLLVAYNIGLSGKGKWMKISENGDLLWAKTTSGNIVLDKILPISGGGYLLTGYDEPTSFTHAMALKINEDGDVLWGRSFGDAGDDALKNCWEDEQGFIYCAGYSGDISLGQDGLLTKLTPTGDVLWERRYGAAGPDQFVSVKPFSGDSTLLLAGYSSGFGTQNEVWLTKVTSEGAIRWSRTYALADQALGAIDILTLPGSQFLISIADPAYQVGSPAILIKIDDGGDLLWVYRYKTGGERDIFREVQPANAGGFVAGGSSTKNGDENIYIAKITADGLIPGSDCCPTFVELTVRDVVSKNEPFTPTSTSSFSSAVAQLLAADAVPETTNICTPIDVEFTLSDSTLCPKECVALTIVGNTPGVTYTLDIQNGELDPNQLGSICHTDGPTLFVTRKGNNGVCEKELSKALPVGSKADAFANAFTPNGDGINDTYKPLFFCPVVTTNFKIYSRWGEKIFETEDPNEAWDGKINGLEAPSDVYVWQVEYEAEREGSRQKFMVKGDVALLR